MIDRADEVHDDWEVHKRVPKDEEHTAVGGIGSKYDGLEPEHLQGQRLLKSSHLRHLFVPVLLDVCYRGSSLLDAAFSSVSRWAGEKDIRLTII